MSVEPAAEIQEAFTGLFAAASQEQRQIRDQVLAALEQFLRRPEVTTPPAGGTLADRFRATRIPDEPSPPDAYFEALTQEIVPHSVNLTSPCCLGHMAGVTPGFVRPLGDLVLGLNQNLVRQDASRVCSLLERQVVAMLHRLVYGEPEEFYGRHVQDPQSTLGIMTSGGTLANLTALWCARNACLGPGPEFAGIEEEGTAAAVGHHGWERAVVVGSRRMHYSIAKAAGILGLGSRGVLEVPVDGRGRADLAAVADAVADCARRRWRIVALVGVAGSTDSGGIDPLAALADIADRAGVHFHVDAAWGAPLLFSERHRGKLAGIERAASVTVDGHKQLYLPFGASLVLLRDPRLARVLEKRSTYILRDGSEDLGRFSVEGSRPAMSLFFHAALHVIGQLGYGALVDANLERTAALARLIAAAEEFELLCEPETNILLYRYLPERLRPAVRRGTLTPADHESLNAVNEAVQQAQYEAGRTYVARTRLSDLPRYPGIPVVALRAVLGNPLTREDDLRTVLEDQLHAAARLNGGPPSHPGPRS